MAAKPTDIPAPRKSDPLDTQFSANSIARSPLAAQASSSWYTTTPPVLPASGLMGSRPHSINATMPVDMLYRSNSLSMKNSMNTDTPFTSLYRRVSASHRSSQSKPITGRPRTTSESMGLSTSLGSSASSEVVLPTTPNGPVEASPSQRYAERMDFVDADGTWPQHLSGTEKMPKSFMEEEAPIKKPEPRPWPPPYRVPSPASERMIMDHLSPL